MSWYTSKNIAKTQEEKSLYRKKKDTGTTNGSYNSSPKHCKTFPGVMALAGISFDLILERFTVLSEKNGAGNLPS